MLTKKKQIRYGTTEFTALDAVPTPGASIDDRRAEALWEVENELATTYNELRRAVKRAIRELTEADERLEAQTAGDVAGLLTGVNSLGILQGTALEVDGGVRRLHGLLRTHAIVLRLGAADAPRGK